MKNRYKLIGLFTLLLFGILFFVRHQNYISFIGFNNENYTNINVYEGESCLHCHQDTKGYSEYHNPELIGCASCHLGNVASYIKNKAHEGMVLIPGNLSDAAETCGKCHKDELHKINKSLMTTNSGLVAVDKYTFGEADSLDGHYHIKDIKDSASDKHLRDLCANCHLGAEKKQFGEINQLSRGGGCNACHLNYSNEAEHDLKRYLASDKTELPQFHPSTDIFVNDTHCFGCHSRSSRISTNYMGLQETLLDEKAVKGRVGYSVLEDKRVYKHQEADVHHTKGMLCIDCHSSHEVMGDGKTYTHEEDAVTLACSDCHFKEKPNTTVYDSLDKESLLVYFHREYTHNDKRILVAKKDGHPLINTYVDSSGRAFLISKNDKKLHELKAQSEMCSRDHAHENVSCSACHSSWTSKCIGCHNEYDINETKAFDLLDKKYVKGQWKEYVAEFSASQPALGVREHNDQIKIEPAIPGMILTIDKGSYSGEEETDVSFHRMYAPNSPHTTTSQVRDCKSCHANPAALGYGNGTLLFDASTNTGTWTFIPEYALNENDNLPEDAWIPFLKPVAPGTKNSTRTNFRPFNIKEQKRMLLVGACLQCHGGHSEVMKTTINIGLDEVIKNVGKSCVLPKY